MEILFDWCGIFLLFVINFCFVVFSFFSWFGIYDGVFLFIIYNVLFVDLCLKFGVFGLGCYIGNKESNVYNLEFYIEWVKIYIYKIYFSNKE